MASKYSATTAHAFLQLPDKVLGVYNSHDTHYTAQLARPLLDEVKDRGNWDYFTKVLEPLQYAVLDMQARGLLLDRGRLNQLRKEMRGELRDADQVVLSAETTGALARPTAKYPNGIGSPRRLGNFLFKELGLRPPKRTDTGLDSTDQESLYRLLRDLRKRDEPHRPILEALFHRSRLRTILQRYLTLEPDTDGRVRAKVKMHGAKTWRYAYSEPPLQQFPPEIRQLLVAQPGRAFVSCDYSQLEARLLAIFSGDTPAIAAFLQGEDIHTQNAKDLLGDIEPSKAARNFAKAFLYGISYGGAAETMKTKLFCPCHQWGCHLKVPPTLKLTREAIRVAQDRWFQIHPAVRRFQNETARHVRQHHYYQSPLGARRWIAVPWGQDLERELKNLPMQFGGALLMNRSQVELHRQGAPVVLQMHDQFLLECPEAEVDQWAQTTKEVMETPVDELDGMVFPVDVQVGPSWGELEEWSG